MKSLAARAFLLPATRLDQHVRDVCVASAYVLWIGMSLLPLFFYVYARSQVQAIRMVAELA